ncbi:MAG: phage tail tape measure protein [Thermoguttaceae bacterium]
MPSIAAVVNYRAKDQTSKEFDRMARRATALERRTKGAFGGMSRSALGFKSVLGGVLGANLISRGTQLLTRGIAVAAREFVDFDQAITVASAKFPEKIKRGTTAFEELQTAARKVGAETQFTAREAADGLALFAAAGVRADFAMSGLQKVVDLATATSVEFEAATQTSLDALGQFGLKADTAAGFASNLERVNNSLVYTINSAKLQMDDLSETLKFVGPVANTAGAQIEEVNSIIAAMADSGIRGSLAGTALKNMYLRLLDPTPKIRKELSKLKVNLDSNNDGIMNMTDIIGQLESKMKGMTKEQKAASLSVLFGKRAVAGAAATLEYGATKIEAFQAAMKGAGNVSQNTAADIRKGLGNQLKILQSSAIELGFRFLKAFDEDGAGAIKKFTKWIQKVNVKPIIKGIKEFAQWIAAVAKTLYDARGLIAAFVAIEAGISLAKTAMVAFNLIANANPVMAIISGLLISIGLLNTFKNKLERARMEEARGRFAPLIEKQEESMSKIQEQMAQAPSDDLEKQLELNEKMANELRVQIRMKNKIKENTEQENKAYQEVKRRMQEIVDLQGRMQAFGPEVFPGELSQYGPLDIPGVETPEAPNSAEASARAFLGRSEMDVNFNNAPAGTTVNTKQSKGAPKINTSMAYAN